jgi:hypothetical protein
MPNDAAMHELFTKLAAEREKSAELERTHKSIMKNHDEMFAEYITSNNSLHRQLEQSAAELERVRKEQYTLEQIKAAFWGTFYGAGEVFFPYESIRLAKECDEAVNTYWTDLHQALTSPERKS